VGTIQRARRACPQCADARALPAFVRPRPDAAGSEGYRQPAEPCASHAQVYSAGSGTARDKAERARIVGRAFLLHLWFRGVPKKSQTRWIILAAGLVFVTGRLYVTYQQA